MTRKQAVSKEEIVEAITRITTEGRKPTMAGVRELIGGSYSTIGPILQEWKENTKTTTCAALELPPTLRDTLEKTTAELWLAASKQAAERIEQIQIDTDAATKEANINATQYAEAIQQLEQEMEKAEELHHAESQSLHKKTALLEGKYNKVYKDCLSKEKDLAVVTAQLIEVRHQVAELQRQLIVSQEQQQNLVSEISKLAKTK